MEIRIVFDILALMGGLLMVASIFYLRPDAPIVSMNPRNWWPGKWKGKERLFFRGPGLHLCRIGAIWMGVAGIGWMILALWG